MAIVLYSREKDLVNIQEAHKKELEEYAKEKVHWKNGFVQKREIHMCV